MGNQPELDLNGLLQSYQQQAQQMAQQQVAIPQGLSAGLLGSGFGAIGNAVGWYSISATPEAYLSGTNAPQSWQQVHLGPPQWKNPYNRLKRFFRINEEIQYNEGQIISEPLDELRIKVAEWLYN